MVARITNKAAKEVVNLSLSRARPAGLRRHALADPTFIRCKACSLLHKMQGVLTAWLSSTYDGSAPIFGIVSALSSRMFEAERPVLGARGASL